MSSADSNTKPGKDPIAIVGIGCRLPGKIKDPASFWNFLANKGIGCRRKGASRPLKPAKRPVGLAFCNHALAFSSKAGKLGAHCRGVLIA